MRTREQKFKYLQERFEDLSNKGNPGWLLWLRESKPTLYRAIRCADLKLEECLTEVGRDDYIDEWIGAHRWALTEYRMAKKNPALQFD